MNNESICVTCPVCNREFHKNTVEEHVNKCLFLNTGAEKNKSKRTISQLSPSSNEKRKKVESLSKTEFKPSSSKPNVDKINEVIPLAEFMRPDHFDDVFGHKETFGPGSILRSMLEQNKIPNMILWGPPGCGKTSIANVISNICKEQNSLRFLKLSAAMSGINDVKEVVKVARNEMKFKRQTVLFMDEIHRFNKLQQDTFLPHVENGTIVLIGATTENPSFSLNNALLSRCRVVVLEKLTTEDVLQILEKAVKQSMQATIIDEVDDDKSLKGTFKCEVERAALRWLAEMSDGDARIALTALDMANSASSGSRFTLSHVQNGMKRSHMLYDRHGEEHYNTISALQKSIRASDDNAALYWTTRALHGGEDPLYIARRLVRTACEDIGLGDQNAVVEAVACLQGCQNIGMPECDVLLAQCAVRLARARKSREVYVAMKRCQKALSEAKGPLPPVPLHLRNAPTKLMHQLGYARGYNIMHKEQSGITYMPEGFENVNFFSPIID